MNFQKPSEDCLTVGLAQRKRSSGFSSLVKRILTLCGLGWHIAKGSAQKVRSVHFAV